MQRKGCKFSIAESCTGGMAAMAMTGVPGASQWFDSAFVTYSNQSKVMMLGVSSETIDQYGAVSEQTATEMAYGVINNSQAQISASITGIAGPSGGTEAKPVGTVCMAWATNMGDIFQSTCQFEGDREEIRQQATIAMMKGLLSKLEGMEYKCCDEV